MSSPRILSLPRYLLLAIAGGGWLLLMALLPVLSLSHWGLLSLGLLLAGFSYRWLQATRLMRRRAWLNLLFRPSAGLKKRLWHSRLVPLLSALQALVAAWVILLIMAHLPATTWWWAAVSLAGFFILLPWFLKRLQGQVVSDYLGLAACRLSLWLSLALIIPFFALYQFFFGEFPDWRAASALNVLEQTRWQGAAVETGWFALFSGVEQSLQQLSLWLMEQLPASLPWWGQSLLWIAWLMWQAAVLALLWLPLLGILHPLLPSLVPVYPRRPWVILRQRALLASLVLLLLVRPVMDWQEQSPASLLSLIEQQAGGVQPQEPACVPVEALQHLARWREQLNRDDEQFHAAMMDEVDERLEQWQHQLLASASPALERYLDWHFSLTGQYQQLYMWARQQSLLPGNEPTEPDRLEQLLQAQMQSAGLEVVDDDALSDLAQSLQESMMPAFGGLIAERSETFRTVPVGLEACLGAPGPTPEFDEWMTHRYVGFGSASVLPAMAGSRLMLAQGGRQLARSALAARMSSRVATGVSTRLGLRAATSGSMAASGAVCGPLCMLTAGVSAWLATDLLISEVEERRYRAELRVQIMGELETLLVAQRQAIRAIIDADLDKASALMNEYQEVHVFNPYRALIRTEQEG